MKRRLILGMVTGAGSVVIKTGLNILLIPVLLHTVGVELYSLYVLMISTLELTQLMDLGFSSALIKILGTCRGADEDTKAPELIRTGHWLYLGLSVLTVLLGLLLIPVFPSLFHLPTEYTHTAELALAIILLEGGLTLYTCYSRSVLYAHCLHQWVNIGDTLFHIASNGVGIALVLSGHGLPALLLTRLASALLRLGLLMTHAWRAEPTLLTLRGSFRFQTLKEMSELSFHAMMINVSVQISHKIDSFVIAYFLPLRCVGIYEIVFRFLSVTLQIGMKISEGVLPLFSRMASHAQKADARQLFLRMSSFTNYVVCMLLLLIVSFYPELFRMLSDGKIPIAATYPVLLVAVPIMWTGGVQMAAGPYLFASGRQRYLTVSSLIAAACNLLLSVLFVRFLGLLGVALGTLIPQLIQHQFSIIRQTCRDLHIGFWSYAWEVHLKVLLILLVAGAWVLMTRSMFSWEGYPILPMVAVSLSTLAISAVPATFLFTSMAERRMLLANVAACLNRQSEPEVPVAKR